MLEKINWEQDDIYVLILTLIVSALVIKIRKANNRLKTVEKENSRLLADGALYESEYLKFQLQPHTLNNILAHLKLTSKKLNNGMDALSEILEYILYHGKHHLVSVKQELDFIDKYIELNDLFLTEIDSIKTDYKQVNQQLKYYNEPCVPHLITAYFLENAFKHGNQKHQDFLNITALLTEEAFELIVINKVSDRYLENRTQKNNPIEGGIGLKNMEKRLELLSSNKYFIETNIKENDQQFVAKLKITFK